MRRFHFHNTPLMAVRRVQETPHLEGETVAHQTGDILWVSPRLNTILRKARAESREMLEAVLNAVTISCWPAIRPQSKLVIPDPQWGPEPLPR